jgi:RecA-family ATPase
MTKATEDEMLDVVRLYVEEDQRRATNGGGGATRPLPIIDMSTWDAAPAPTRPWHIMDYIPSRQPTLISGPGGGGKSILLLQLQAASSLAQPWIGSLWPKPGPTLYLGAEDEQDEIWRRLEPILDHHNMRFADLLAGGFKALAYAGQDAVLATFDRNGRIKPTELFSQLYETARALKPTAVVIDALSDVFLGDELKREQVRQFGSLMRKLAIDCNTAAIMASHPSVSGMKSGSGLSGSTQWHNTVRARLFSEAVQQRRGQRRRRRCGRQRRARTSLFEEPIRPARAPHPVAME